MRIVVTGGAGFIGSALVRGLIAQNLGSSILVADNLLTGKRSNLLDVEDRIEFQQADIRDYPAVEGLLRKADLLFHLAAVPSVPRSISDPVLAHEVNIDGTFNVLLAAQRCGVRRVVYAASSSAYGDTPTLPKIETMLPMPKSPYAVQKLLGEYYGRVFTEVYGLETVSLRFFNVFGPRQDPSSPYSGVISVFISALLDRRAPTIFGDGEQTRDFTYVDNIVQLCIKAAQAPEAAGKLYNGGVGARITLNETWRLLQKIEGVEIPPVYGPPRPGDVRDSQADISAARRDLSYQPCVDFETGLRRTLEWFRSK
ncbi:MAG TPA: SDR family oxidoreductase [Bryobacterales bacterium]|jgi:nucleoside-diphosphate-sugar epimerase|nr:SDR family oxidoreductase [Bryobacterales bacterium]